MSQKKWDLLLVIVAVNPTFLGHLVVEKFIYLLLLEWVTESPGGKGKYFKTLTEKLSTLQMSENLTCYFPLLATYYFQKRFYHFESFPLSIEKP